ncbi:MAG: 5-formyltetrahydrofolate cyclo-ligase [Clostridia bacterium]|nr:5-formyltetrahydrofolate cyclo-ligase [Clostridia bacterium]
MQITDIRPIKQELREKYKAARRAMEPSVKAEKDRRIASSVRRLWQYDKHDTLLCYVSTAIEVDTRQIIEQALKDGKRVAVPRCVPGTRQMEFYYIHSLDELEKGTFGVLEPRPDPTRLLTDMQSGLCLIPALCYDLSGFRLGYGKGYYDRFLASFEGSLVGLCYSDGIERNLPHGRYDRPVETLVTDQFIRRIDRRH